MNFLKKLYKNVLEKKIGKFKLNTLLTLATVFIILFSARGAMAADVEVLVNVPPDVYVDYNHNLTNQAITITVQGSTNNRDTNVDTVGLALGNYTISNFPASAMVAATDDHNLGGYATFTITQNGTYTAYAKDIKSAVYVFTVTNFDAIPPTAPSNLLSPNKSDQTVDLSWSPATDNASDVYYDIYRGSTLIGSTTVANTTTFTALNLLPQTTFTFSVKAKDIAGNVSSSSSNVITVTTNPTVVSVAESGNTTDEANPINLDKQYSSYMDSDMDVDFYKYTPSANELDKVSLIVPSDKNYDVYIYDSTMDIVAAGLHKLGLNESAYFNLNAGSTYFIKIVGTNGDFGTSPYTLSLSKTLLKYQTTYQYDANGNVLRKYTTVIN